jgi:Ulp1 family protease
VFDSPGEVIQSEKDVADELDLWSNAQFTFDVKPGVGIFDEEKSKTSSSPKTITAANSPSNTSAAQFESASGLDPVTYDTLVNYLDYELPRQQQDKLEPTVATPKVAAASVKNSPLAIKKQRIQPRPLAPALPALAPNVTATSVGHSTISRQILMPKPPSTNINANILSSLLATATTSSNVPASPVAISLSSPKKTTATVKRAISEVELNLDESTNPDEDKRRRNTAASARFRVKKKMREQAMEHSVREMTEKSDKLQDRVNNLESEIKYLRSLLLDKAAHGQ